MKTKNTAVVDEAPIESLPALNKRDPEWLRRFKDGKYIFIMVLTSIICLALFYYLPMYGISIAFMDYKPFLGFIKSDWVWFENFERFFKYRFFWRTIKSTFLLSFWSLVWGFPAPIIFALLLNEVTNTKFKKFVQTVHMPHFYSTVVVVGLFTLFLAPTGGLITRFLSTYFGSESQYPCRREIFQNDIHTIGNMAGMGWGAIIYLAA